LLSDAFQAEPDAGGRRWGFKELARVTFPNVGSGRADLVLTNGQTVAGRPVSAEMEFQLRAGPRLRWHAGRIRQLRKPGELPADFLVRIGVPPDRGLGLESGRGPDPTVMPAGDLVWIPPGEFTMGSPPEERERDLDEGPPTRVVLPEGFWIGRHEVTQAEYEGVVGTNPSRYAGDGRLPVEKLTWTEAMDYCARLTARERASGRLPAAYAYRLPTEAEWEHACRSGSSGRYHFGDEVNPAALAAYAWFGDNSDSTPHPVGTRQANAWGLHDLHGNVLEWCLDAWQGSLPGGTITNRVTVPQGTLRVARGGSWLYPARACRSANRESYGMLNRCSDLGFRVVLARTGDAQP
jgi:formylglycine-generating enzyme required for sulfatase activity